MLIAYLEQIGCVGLGRGEHTQFNTPWEAFATALATREGLDVSEVLGRVSVTGIDGIKFWSDTDLAQLVGASFNVAQRDIQSFRVMFCRGGLDEQAI
jgi:hypothetical protein